MMSALYLDTSCLLKLFLPEPETSRVQALVAAETAVAVSTLTHFEAQTHIHARLAGGMLTRRRAAALSARLDAVLALAPFSVMPTPVDLAAVAKAQLAPMAKRRHCRSMDRLHLAAMQALSLRRLLTNDGVQADAARDLGFEVSLPR